MKKFYLTLQFMLMFQLCFSQTEKGKKVFGGQINLRGYSTSNLNQNYSYSYNSSSLNVNPSIGYFISNNFAIGANMSLGYSKVKTRQQNLNLINSPDLIYDYKSNEFKIGLGAFARYYIDITKKLKLNIIEGINYAYGIQKGTKSNNIPNYEYSVNQPKFENIRSHHISMTVSPGLVYFVTPQLGIQTSFGGLYYQINTSKNKNVPYNNYSRYGNFGFEVNMSSFYFGVNYYF